MNEDKLSNMSSPDSGFFLPLKGHENSSRLKAKFEHYFDSDDDQSQSSAVEESVGKVSQWKPSPQGKWLQSPTKSRKRCVVASGGNAKYVSPNYRKRVKENPRKAEIEKLDKQVTQSHEKTKTSSLSTSLTKKSRLDIHEYSSEDQEEWEQTISSKDTRKGPSAKMQIEKASPRTPTLHASRELNQLGEKFVNVWHEFSEVDAERPKLPAEPVSAKLDFVLLEDDTQPRIAVPAAINQYLRDYQREGIQFLFEHFMKGTGAILGDDMGLGKTVQVIGFLSALLGKTGCRIDTVHAVPKFIKQMSNDFPDTPPKKATHPFLIIGPTAVLYNWLDELNTWGYFTIGKFHGSDKDACFEDLKKGKLEIVITTFETYRDKVEQLNQIEWEAVIVDEVHKIKGLRAQVTQALRIIKTPCRFGLTGTALQNNMRELWSLLDWAQPKVLGSLEQFENGIVRAIENGQKHDATKRELAHARKQRDKFASIRKKMFLRRTKKLIADQLPNKEDLVVLCRLTDIQVSVYKAILEHPDMQLVLQAEDPCDCGSGKQRASCCYKFRTDGTKVWSLVFSFMHLVLKAANHVGLLIPESDSTRYDQACLGDKEDIDDKAENEKPSAALAKSVFLTAFKEQTQFVDLTRSAAFRTLSDPRYCGKMKILQGLLQVFEKNHDKVLIFSYSTKLLDIIEQYIISQGHEYSRIDGKVSGQRRRDIVLQFNTDPSLFICLISTKAGGLGLNLTGANKVVIFDPNWNPSHDLQAQDRAYRIGQTRDVKVFRLVSAGTIEENIYLRQIYKQQFDEVAIGSVNARRYFHGVQGDKSNQGELFGVKNMFALRTGDACLTMDILKRNERLEKGLAGYDITKYVPAKIETKASNGAFEDEDEDGIEESVSDYEKAEKEEKEEDENFLKDIFGLDHIDLKPSSSTTMEPSKSMNQGSQAMKICSESSHSDGEFSLFPSRKHHRQKGKSRGTLDSTLANNFSHSKGTQKKSVQSHFLDSEASSAQGVASGVGKGLSVSTVSNAFDELFDMSDITFSTARVSAHSSNIADKDKSTKPDSQSGVRVEKVYAFSKSAGLSWLFSDSEDESDDENGERVEAQKASFSSTSEKKQVATSSTFSKKRVQILNPHDQSRQNCKAGSSKSARIKSTFSSEQSFLAGSDILHTHINTGVLGASRAEDHMTRCAIKDVYELNMNTQAPALVCDPLSQPDDEEYGSEKQTKGKGKRKKTLSSQESKEENYDKRQSIKAGTCKLLIGQTPPSIARRQFSELARSKDMSELDLARYVVETSLGCRLDMLKEFYSQKHSKIELVEAVTKLYSITSKSGTAKPEIGIFPSGVDKIRKISDAESSKTTHQTPYKYQTTGTCASSNGERQRKSPGRSSPINPREQPCSSRAPTPFFLEPCTYASDSQESITAKSPKLCHVDASTDSQGYQPVSPPPKRRLSPHIKKVSPVKSKHRTRLRHLQNKDKKEETVTFQHEYQEISTYLPQDKFSNQPDIGMVMQNIQPSEDISSLLHEMGHDGSLSVEEKSVNSSKNIISNSGRSRLPKVQVSHDVIASKTRKGSSMMHIKSSSDKARATSTRRRQAVSVLDDIFGDNPPSSLKEDQVCEGPDSKFDDIPHGTKKCDRRKNKEPSAEAKQSISKIELHGTSTKSDNWTESEIKPAKGNRTPAKIINNRSKDTPGTSTTAAVDAFMDDYNESEILNAIITSSTFHEEAQPTCLHKSSVTRRNREEKKRLQTTMKCVRDKKLLEEEQNAGADFDDLENWGKFNLNHPAPIESESLFS